MSTRSFKDLIVWQKAMALVKVVYQLAQQLPQEEKYGLSSQIRRSALSIPSNIAEGSKRGTTKDYIQFLRIANGSVAELETQALLIKELYNEVDTQFLLDRLEEIQKMLTVLIKNLQSK